MKKKKNSLEICEKNHVLVELNGGLGNQLFQFANGISYALKNNSNICFNFLIGSRSFALQFLEIQLNLCYTPSVSGDSLNIVSNQKCETHAQEKLFERYIEQNFTFDQIPNSYTDVKFQGYFQSFKYSTDFERVLRNYIKSKLDSYGTNLEAFVVSHVRLGDLITNPIARDYHGILTDKYYTNAVSSLGISKPIALVTENIDQAKYFFPELCSKTELFISQSAISDLASMAKSKYLITANSTLSLWAAFISEAKTVVPSNWFSPKVLEINTTSDLFLENWIVV